MFTIKSVCLSIVMIAMAATSFAAGGGEVVAADPSKHFDPKGNLPSEFTIELQNGQRKALPFEDKRDFDEFGEHEHKHFKSGIFGEIAGNNF